MSISRVQNELKVSIHDIILSESGFVALLRPDEDPFKDQILVVNVGFLEAQLLTVQFNKVPTNRPLIIDTVHNLFSLFHLSVKKVVINEIQEDTFLSQIFLENQDQKARYILDSKTSDALIFALNFNASIYVTQEIIREKAIPFNFYKEDEEYEEQKDSKFRLKSLKQFLKQAIQEENYEEAARLRDEIKKLKGESSD